MESGKNSQIENNNGNKRVSNNNNSTDNSFHFPPSPQKNQGHYYDPQESANSTNNPLTGRNDDSRFSDVESDESITSNNDQENTAAAPNETADKKSSDSDNDPIINIDDLEKADSNLEDDVTLPGNLIQEAFKLAHDYLHAALSPILGNEKASRIIKQFFAWQSLGVEPTFSGFMAWAGIYPALMSTIKNLAPTLASFFVLINLLNDDENDRDIYNRYLLAFTIVSATIAGITALGNLAGDLYLTNVAEETEKANRTKKLDARAERRKASKKEEGSSTAHIIKQNEDGYELVSALYGEEDEIFDDEKSNNRKIYLYYNENQLKYEAYGLDADGETLLIKRAPINPSEDMKAADLHRIIEFVRTAANHTKLPTVFENMIFKILKKEGFNKANPYIISEDTLKKAISVLDWSVRPATLFGWISNSSTDGWTISQTIDLIDYERNAFNILMTNIFKYGSTLYINGLGSYYYWLAYSARITTGLTNYMGRLFDKTGPFFIRSLINMATPYDAKGNFSLKTALYNFCCTVEAGLQISSNYAQRFISAAFIMKSALTDIIMLDPRNSAVAWLAFTSGGCNLVEAILARTYNVHKKYFNPDHEKLTPEEIKAISLTFTTTALNAIVSLSSGGALTYIIGALTAEFSNTAPEIIWPVAAVVGTAIGVNTFVINQYQAKKQKAYEDVTNKEAKADQIAREAAKESAANDNDADTKPKSKEDLFKEKLFKLLKPHLHEDTIDLSNEYAEFDTRHTIDITAAISADLRKEIEGAFNNAGAVDLDDDNANNAATNIATAIQFANHLNTKGVLKEKFEVNQDLLNELKKHFTGGALDAAVKFANFLGGLARLLNALGSTIALDKFLFTVGLITEQSPFWTLFAVNLFWAARTQAAERSIFGPSMLDSAHYFAAKVAVGAATYTSSAWSAIFYPIDLYDTEKLQKTLARLDAKATAKAEEAKLKEDWAKANPEIKALDPQFRKDVSKALRYVLDIHKKLHTAKEQESNPKKSSYFSNICHFQRADVKTPTAIAQDKKEILRAQFAKAVLSSAYYLNSNDTVDLNYSPKQEVRNDSEKERLLPAAKPESALKTACDNAITLLEKSFSNYGVDLTENVVQDYLNTNAV